MATRGENCNDWPSAVMTGGCLLVAFAPDEATGNDDDESQRWEGRRVKIWIPSVVGYGFFLEWPIVADVTDLPTFMILS